MAAAGSISRFRRRGDATDLSGGTLLVTPLMAADGEVYAVAQGQLVTSAFSAQGAAASVTRNIPTSARMANGAIVEREVPMDLSTRTDLHLSLRNPDLTTAERISTAVNAAIGFGVARASDPRTVALSLVGRDVVATLATIEDLMVEPDSPAIVVVDEASGTIVMGDNVRISTVAIAQGNLTIQVAETPQVSQPGPFSNGQTTIVPRTSVQVDTGAGKRLGILQQGPSLRDLVSGLNSLGVGPRDMISILQTIKAAGRAAGEPGGAMTIESIAGHGPDAITPGAAPVDARVWKAAKDFETMAINQLLEPMFSTVDTSEGFFGGGHRRAEFSPDAGYRDGQGGRAAWRTGLGNTGL